MSDEEWLADFVGSMPISSEAALIAYNRGFSYGVRSAEGELEQLRRLHEVATERTVQLAAVIEKAKAWNDHGTGRPEFWDLYHVLASADTSVLRERDAAKWDEGWEDRHGLPEGRTLLLHRIGRNPYRQEGGNR